ncbi:MAG: type I-MYXAN CRISPR-associated protein Cas6/Cmx6 [Rhodocyclaceae bacterium]|nr:type I-MYXAN CRISPR-associated protein Cas6/Cmx6 [Rhodocyclaceae bacterium]
MTDAANPAEQFVDLQFALQGYAVPHEYIDALWAEVRGILPWMETDALAGLHLLSGLSPGEGEWYISGRSRLALRLARQQVDLASAALSGARLQLGANQVEVGAASVRELAHTAVLYARFVTFTATAPARLDEPMSDEPMSEADFQTLCQQQLTSMGLAPRLIFGKAQRAQTSVGALHGFSLMLAGLGADATRQIQRHGLGDERKRGCGIFVPHKSMAAAGTLE